MTVEEIVHKIPKQLTKRMILSQVATLYDPLGLVTTFTICCKLLMRQLITLRQESKADEQVGWVEPIPEEMHARWVHLFQDMYALEELKFKRCITPHGAIGDPILVIYADASNIAYSTCAYVRFELKDGTFSAQLLAAKSRIAPIRQITVPRLELCAAVLAARLRKAIERETSFTFRRVLHLTDSMIVRSQIQNESHGFGAFVGTRIAEIQTHTDTSEWWWVATDGNAADYATRPHQPPCLGSDSVWQRGPNYLTLPINQWPIDQPCMKELPDKNTVSLQCNIKEARAPLMTVENFSCYNRMIKTIAMILSIAKKRTFKGILHALTPDNLKEAEKYWVKRVQHEFREDWNKRFRRLGPSKDEEGIIVVGERISNWLKDNWNQSQFVHFHNTIHSPDSISLTCIALTMEV